MTKHFLSRRHHAGDVLLGALLAGATGLLLVALLLATARYVHAEEGDFYVPPGPCQVPMPMVPLPFHTNAMPSIQSDDQGPVIGSPKSP